MKGMKKLPHGQIFAVPMPDGTYIFGRVMLDIYGVQKRRLLPVDSPLPFFNMGYLIEMYSGIQKKPEYVPSPILIAGAFVESKEVGNAWPVVGHEPVDPKKVEFPEGLIGYDTPQGEVALQCGEMRIPVPMIQRGAERKVGENVVKDVGYFFLSGGEVIYSGLGSYPSSHWSYMCLWALGRVDEIPAEWPGVRVGLARGDLRFSPRRAEVYAHLPFPMELSYYEKQKQMGFNLERLYE